LIRTIRSQLYRRSQASLALLERSLTLAIVFVAGLQCICGFFGYILLFQSPRWNYGEHGIFAVHELVFVASGVLLLTGGASERRSIEFGLVALLSATAYAKSGVNHLAVVYENGLFELLPNLPVDALFPYYFWRFARLFPRVFIPVTLDRALNWMVRFLLFAGLFLLSANLLGYFFPASAVSDYFDNYNNTGAYSALIYGLTLPALPVLWFRMKNAKEDERRRVRVFVSGLLVSFVPPLAFIVVTSLSSDAAAFVSQEHIRRFLFPLLQSFVIAAPILTTYAVLVERTLPVKVLLKSSIRFSLGIGFLSLAIMAPLGLFFYYLYALRSSTIAGIFEGFNGIFLLIAFGVSAALFLQRHRAHHYLELLFYREQYDANDILTDLTLEASSTTDLKSLNVPACNAVLRALHPHNSYMLVINETTNLYDPAEKLASLPLNSNFGKKLLLLRQPTLIDSIKADASTLELLWLSQSAASLIVPIKVANTTLGYLLLSEKQSELPFSQADYKFLNLVANTIATSTSRLLERDEVESGTAPARQCKNCHLVFEKANACPECDSSEYGKCLLPKVLHYHFEVKRALAEGGMGAVYLATDLRLNRDVVLKTVLSNTPEELEYLRNEARLMATFTHKNIATIHGFETYRGVPILVCEYLVNGTLQDLLEDGYLSAEEAFQFLRQTAEALDYLHRRGIVHGDIKPSNIGFDGEETPKLLDFGLALNARSDDESSDSPEGGTYAYMSPERMRGGGSDASSDIWAMGVIYCQMLYGLNPFGGKTVDEISQKLVEPEETLKSLPEIALPCFNKIFSSNPRQRPQRVLDLLSIFQKK